MLSAYLDASGTHDASRVLVVAGLLSTPDDWERLTEEWQGVLDGEGLADFHASDCAAGGGAFRDRVVWPAPRRQDLYMRLARITATRSRWRIWAAIVVEEYRDTFDDERMGFGICAGLCAQQACLHAVFEGPNASMPYVFDQGDLHGRFAFDSFDEMMSRGNPFRIQTLTKADRRVMLPLQAADLHAYEIYRFFSDQVLSIQDGNSRTLRSPLRELFAIREAYPLGCGGHILVGENLAIVRQRFDLTVVKNKDMPTVHTYRLDANTQPRLRRLGSSWSVEGIMGGLKV